jgi:hypothetical protein
VGDSDGRGPAGTSAVSRRRRCCRGVSLRSAKAFIERGERRGSCVVDFLPSPCSPLVVAVANGHSCLPQALPAKARGFEPFRLISCPRCAQTNVARCTPAAGWHRVSKHISRPHSPSFLHLTTSTPAPTRRFYLSEQEARKHAGEHSTARCAPPAREHEALPPASFTWLIFAVSHLQPLLPHRIRRLQTIMLMVARCTWLLWWRGAGNWRIKFRGRKQSWNIWMERSLRNGAHSPRGCHTSLHWRAESAASNWRRWCWAISSRANFRSWRHVHCMRSATSSSCNVRASARACALSSRGSWDPRHRRPCRLASTPH